MTLDTPNETEAPEVPVDPDDGVIEGADTDGYVNDDSPDRPENPDADGGDDEVRP